MGTQALSARAAALALAIWLAVPAQALAHRDDYIDETFVYQTLAAHERELEGWAEVHAGRDRRPQFWYTGAFEWGLTSRWTLDAASQWLHREGATTFGRLRSETRYRFSEEGRRPIDMAASLEYELETKNVTGEDNEATITPRLVLSRDLSRSWNTTVNLDFPVAISGGGLEFQYAIGTRYPAEGFLRVGTEFKQTPGERSAVLFPQVWFALPDEMTLKLGVGIGLAREDDPVNARAAFEAEF
ncbi:MAG: hypothetical protein ACM3PF_10260 [Bacteroidota bacterium]